MKYLNKLFSIILFAMLFSSCTETKKKENEFFKNEQLIFNNFIKSKCEGYRGAGNDIKKDEYISKYKQDLKNITDSIKIEKNWYGKITEIRTSNWDSFGLTEINVEIEVEISEYQKIKFQSKNVYSIKDIDSNLLYRQLKELKEGQNVYFTGIFGKDSKDDLEFYNIGISSDYSKNETVCSPTFIFNLAAVSTSKLNFINNENFKVCDEQIINTWKLMNESIRSKYPSSKLSTELKKIAIIMKPYSDKFTKEEKDYYQSLTNCFKMNFKKI